MKHYSGITPSGGKIYPVIEPLSYRSQNMYLKPLIFWYLIPASLRLYLQRPTDKLSLRPRLNTAWTFVIASSPQCLLLLLISEVTQNIWTTMTLLHSRGQSLYAFSRVHQIVKLMKLWYISEYFWSHN